MVLSIFVIPSCVLATTSTSGVLEIRSTLGGFVFRNRTQIAAGQTLSPFHEIGHVNDDTMVYTTPTVTWLKDGEPVSTVPTNVPVGSNGGLRTTLTLTMMASDVGVYQCVFTDAVRSELFVTVPLRLEIGKL